MCVLRDMERGRLFLSHVCSVMEGDKLPTIECIDLVSQDCSTHSVGTETISTSWIREVHFKGFGGHFTWRAGV